MNETWYRKLDDDEYDQSILDDAPVVGISPDHYSDKLDNTTTLAEWSKQTGILPTYPTTERQATSIVVEHDNPDYRLLWDLSDYIVSSVSGIVVWLTPRKITDEN